MNTITKKELIVPERTRKWLLKCCPLIVALDFSGYVFSIDTKKKLMCAITLNSDIIYYSMDEKHPTISKRKNERITKKLLKNKFLEYDFNPFPELKRLPDEGAKIFTIPFNYFLDNDTRIKGD